MVKRSNHYTKESKRKKSETLKARFIDLSSDQCKMCTSFKHTTAQHKKRLIKGRLKSKLWRKAVVKANRKLRLGSHASKATKKKMGKSCAANWQDPNYRKQQTISRRAAWARRTPEEVRAIADKISRAQVGRAPASFGFRCWYKSKKRGIEICMRSTWEVAFAKKLDKWKMKWKYEPKGFLVGRGNWNGSMYYPDFYLPEFDLYIEVKGYLRADNKRKLKRFRKRYPDIRWMMLQKEELEMLGVFTKDKSTRKQAKALFITD